MNDERLGLPSASSIARLAACPGSQRLCAGIPDQPTADSDFGTHVHEWLAGTRISEHLTPEELDIAESCKAIEVMVVKQWKLRNEIPDDAEVVETRDSERLWILHNGKKAVSGVADVVYRWDDRALVIDFKTLPGDHKEATDNLQLRCLACLVDASAKHLLGAVDVVIIQPLKTHTPQVCHYDTEALKSAHEELGAILRAANKPDAPLIAGDQCRFCRANSVCPAVHQEIQQLSALTIHQAGLSISDEDIAQLRDKCGSAKRMISAIEAEAFRRAEANPELWRKMGWEITDGAGKRAVNDVSTVYDRLNAKGVTPEDFSKSCSITIKSVETLTRAATGEKGMGLKRAVDEVLADCCQIKKAKPSLKRIGAAAEEEDEA